MNKDLTLGVKQQPFGRHHGVYHNGKPWTSQHHQNSLLMLLNKSFFLKRGIFL